MKSVAVVSVNFGSTEMLRGSLGGLSEGVKEKIIVDNFHSTDERTKVRQVCAEQGWTLIEQDENIGFGAAVNLAASRAFSAGCEYVLLLNPDARIDSTSLSKLVAGSSEFEIVSPRILQSDGSIWFAGATLNRLTGIARHAFTTDASTRPDWLTGACLLVPRKPWQDLGGFDPNFFLYWEDVDLSVRAKSMGYSLRIDHEVDAQHDAGGTQGGSGKSPTYVRYNLRNRRLIARRLSPPLRLLWLLSTPYYLTLMIRVAGLKTFLGRGGAAHRHAVWRGLTEPLGDGAERLQ